MMSEFIERIIDELSREYREEIKKRESMKLKEVARRNLMSEVENRIREKFSVECSFETHQFDFKPNTKIKVKGELKVNNKTLPISVEVSFDREGQVVSFAFIDEKGLKSKLGVKKYAVRINNEIYEVEAINEKLAVKNVLKNVLDERKKLIVDGRVYSYKDIDWLSDELVKKKAVLEWGKFISSSERIDEYSDEPIVYEYESELRHLSSLMRGETESIIDRFLKNEIDLHKHILNVAGLKRVISSVIESDLSQYGIDATVEIKNITEDSLYKSGTVKGVVEITSSFFNASVPFTAEISKDGFVNKVSYRDKEIKRIADLKVYSILINGKEMEVLATGVPVVLETLSRLLGRKLTIDELIEKYGLKEKGSYTQLIDDSKEVSAWKTVVLGDDTYLVRIK